MDNDNPNLNAGKSLLFVRYLRWDIDKQDEELGKAWNSLAMLEGLREVGIDDIEPTTGERWEYLGTGFNKEQLTWIHVFRHRYHPKLNRRVYSRIPCTPNWMPEDMKINVDED